MTDIRVKCECGWEGTQNDLIGTRMIGGKLYCPECEKPFKPYPIDKGAQINANQATS